MWRDEIKKLKAGDKVFAYLNTRGYVGAGTIVSEAVRAPQFISPVFDRPLTELLPHDSGWFINGEDDDNAEYMVGVQWLSTRDVNDGVRLEGPVIRGTVRRILAPDRAASLQAAFGLIP